MTPLRRIFALFLVPPLLAAQPKQTLVIRDVAIVDMNTGAVSPHNGIAIRGDRIVAVGPLSKIRIPAPMKTISGAGKFVIPGLWDMHVHLWYKDNQFPLYLANGVTGVRDMGSSMKQIHAWRAEMKRGQLLGPRIVACGSPVTGVGHKSHIRMPLIELRSPQEARHAFDVLDDQMEVDCINVLSDVSKTSYQAVAEVSRHWGVPIVGHVPDSMTAMEAAFARQSTMEHLFGLMLACSSDEDSLRDKRAEALRKGDAAAMARVDTAVLETYDQRKASVLFDRFRIYDVRQTPTLVMRRRMAFLNVQELLDSPHLRYVDQSIRRSWPDISKNEGALSAEQQLVVRKEYERLLTLVRDMDRASVPILAGTDTGDPFTVPGFELHDELELLVKAGLTPLHALRSATVEPARLIRQESTLGVVKPQYLADLVLLDANPILDIRNTRRVSAVVVNGQYLSKSDLAGMLQNSAARALKQ